MKGKGKKEKKIYNLQKSNNLQSISFIVLRRVRLSSLYIVQVIRTMFSTNNPDLRHAFMEEI